MPRFEKILGRKPRGVPVWLPLRVVARDSTLQPVEMEGGFFVDVRVYKELEDLPRPIRATAGSAAFRSDNTVDRQFEVIDHTVFESNWIPLGRDPSVEQLLLQQMKKCLPGG